MLLIEYALICGRKSSGRVAIRSLEHLNSQKAKWPNTCTLYPYRLFRNEMMSGLAVQKQNLHHRDSAMMRPGARAREQNHGLSSTLYPPLSAANA